MVLGGPFEARELANLGCGPARISHDFSATAPDPSARAALRLVGLLDVTVKYASVALPARALP